MSKVKVVKKERVNKSIKGKRGSKAVSKEAKTKVVKR